MGESCYANPSHMARCWGVLLSESPRLRCGPVGGGPTIGLVPMCWLWDAGAADGIASSYEGYDVISPGAFTEEKRDRLSERSCPVLLFSLGHVQPPLEFVYCRIAVNFERLTTRDCANQHERAGRECGCILMDPS